MYAQFSCASCNVYLHSVLQYISYLCCYLWFTVYVCSCPAVLPFCTVALQYFLRSVTMQFYVYMSYITCNLLPNWHPAMYLCAQLFFDVCPVYRAHICPLKAIHAPLFYNMLGSYPALHLCAHHCSGICSMCSCTATHTALCKELPCSIRCMCSCPGTLHCARSCNAM
jgi:hypothetical protein